MYAKAAEIIMSSINNPGKKGGAHEDMLLAKVDNLEKLTALCNSISRWLLCAAEKLANGIPKEKVTVDMVVYSRFIVDQLKREEEECQHILGTLQNND